MGLRPKVLVALVSVLMLVTVLLAAEAADHDTPPPGQHHRHSGRKNNGGRRRMSTTTSTTTEKAVQVAEDEQGVTSRQQDQPAAVDSCEVAQLKCAYRVGCGMALQNYMRGCADVIRASSQRCSDHCRNSLIALTSTEEGEALMKCKCSDSYCSDSKQRIDICRSAVLRATHNSTTVSCSVAQWICMADPLCSTALDYYHRFCRLMFVGKKCTARCKNSISILRRQEKAAKLSTCVCDGTEDYDCPSILDNMDRLCYGNDKLPPSSTSTPPKKEEGGAPGVEDDDDSSSSNEGRTESGHHPGQNQPKPRPHQPPRIDHTNDDIDSNEVETRRHHPNKTSNSFRPTSKLFLFMPIVSAIIVLLSSIH